ncbi:MAG: ABC transporter substrate-binding protein [Candidatus Methylomirabilia bacterium]
MQELRDLGRLQGQNLIIEWRGLEGKFARLPSVAAELVRLKPDVLMAGGTPAPLALKRATTTIPIVMWAAGDPVGTGLVGSLARPGGNVTALSTFAVGLAGKRLEILTEVVTALSRVAVLWNAANSYAQLAFRETESAARQLKVTLLRALGLTIPPTILFRADRVIR